jgi:hypothetical protein
MKHPGHTYCDFISTISERGMTDSLYLGDSFCRALLFEVLAWVHLWALFVLRCMRVKFSALLSRIGFGCVSYSLRVVTRSWFDFSIWINSMPFSLRESRGQRQVSVLTTSLSIHEFFCSLVCLRRFSSFNSKVFAVAFFSRFEETAPKDSCSLPVPTTQLPVVISGLGSSR